MTSNTWTNSRSNASLWVVRILATVAMIVSGYLAVVSWQAKGPAGCGATAVVDCDDVLKSRWSSWFNIPVSLPAAFVYFGLLVSSFLRHKRVVEVFRALGMTVGLAAVWFTSLQILLLQMLCSYCLIVHVCGWIIFVVIAISMIKPIQTELKLPMRVFGMALLAMAILVGGQFVYSPPEFNVEEVTAVDAETTNELDMVLNSQAKNSIDDISASDDSSTAMTGEDSSHELEVETIETDLPPRRTVSLLNGAAKIDTALHPLVGSPDADEILVKLFDYTCKNCRRMHHQLEKYATDKSIAFVVLPVPMNKQCNAYVKTSSPEHIQACDFAQLALAVWMTDKTKFEAFHHWMMESEHPPSLTAARVMAEEFTGSSEVIGLMTSHEIAKKIHTYTQIYKASKLGVIPKLFVRNRVIIGSASEQAKLERTLDSILSMPK